MKAHVVSKELLELEKNKPSLLESNFLVYKKEEESKTVQTKTRKKRKQGDTHDKEEGKQQAMTTIPTSQVLGKVKNFLGVIAEANEKLQQSAQEKGRADFDIEALSGTEREYIEMDLLLGLTDLKTPEAVAAAEAAIDGSHQYLRLLDENSPSSSQENSDEERNQIAADTSLSNTKAPERSGTSRSSKCPKITVLD